MLTEWIGKAWEEVSANKEMVIRGFKKCGISVSVDGSEDDQINIKDLEGYEVESTSSNSSDSNSDDASQCDDSVNILSSEGEPSNDETLLQTSTEPFNSITDMQIFRPFLWMDYPVDVDSIAQDYFTVGKC